MIQAQILSNADKTVKDLKRIQVDLLKAENTAVRVEGFRLMKQLRQEIRQGAPGGKRFAALSQIRRTMGSVYRGHFRLRGNNPLFRLARAIGYEVNDGTPFSLTIGFVGKASSRSWRMLALKHQQGFSESADAPYFRYHNISIRDYLVQEGSRVDRARFGGKKTRRRNVFFLRKSTQMLRTPARPIIDPFWAAHRAEAARNIRQNFIRKMKGERI